MQQNRIKMIACGGGALAFAGAFGLSLASYAESGSFAFYKQHSPAAWSLASPEQPVAVAALPAGAPFGQMAAPTAMPPVSRAEYPQDAALWREDTRDTVKPAVFERAEPEPEFETRVIPETRGSWTEPMANERVEMQADSDDEAWVEAAPEDRGDAADAAVESD